MRTRWLVPILALAFALLPSAGLAESTADLRQPDRVLRPCAEGDKCLVRAVGDFNGDRVDDLLFEVIGRNAIRHFELVLGPYETRAAPADAPLSPTTRFPLPSSRRVSVLPPQDINADGKDDLIFFAATRSQNYEWQRVAVLYGRAEWPENFDPGSASRGDLVFNHQRALDPKEDREAPPRMSAAIADVNGDGRWDVLIGSDPVPEMEIPGRDAPAKPAKIAGSEIVIQFGREGLAGWIDFAPDVRIGALGTCSQGLAGAGDVTGDGVADVVARQCSGTGLPERLTVLPGRAAWPESMLASETISAARRSPGVDGADVPPPSPPPGRGYLPAVVAREPESLAPAPGFFIGDLNDDGVDDILFEFGDMAHVFSGGADIAARMSAGLSDRIVLGASFGATMFAQSWRRADLDGDHRLDLLLAEQPAASPQSATPPRAGSTNPPVQAGTPIMMFKGGDGYETEEVLDAEDRVPSATWRDPASHLWGLGDFNGDGITDVLLGSASTDLKQSLYPVVFGPFTSGGATTMP